jgi:hypothetical protein
MMPSHHLLHLRKVTLIEITGLANEPISRANGSRVQSGPPPIGVVHLIRGEAAGERREVKGRRDGRQQRRMRMWRRPECGHGKEVNRKRRQTSQFHTSRSMKEKQRDPRLFFP